MQKRKPPSAYPKSSAIQKAVRASRKNAAERKKREAAKRKTEAKSKRGGKTIKIAAHTRKDGTKVKAHTRKVSGKSNYHYTKARNGMKVRTRKKTAPRKYTW